MVTLKLFIHVDVSPQRCIASTNSSGIDIMVSLIQTNLTHLDDRTDLEMKIKVQHNSAYKRTIVHTCTCNTYFYTCKYSAFEVQYDL